MTTARGRTIYDDLLARLRAAFALCEALGVTKIRTGRYGDYERTLEKLAASCRAAAVHDPAAADKALFTPNNFSAVCETLLFAGVFPFEHGDANALRAKLDIIAKGPPDPADERPDQSGSGNQPRNILFELSTAARFARAGLPIRLGEEPDITCTVGADNIGVACTRPFSEKSVAERIRHAARDLRGHLQNYHSPNSRGIVAVALSRLWNPGGKYFWYSDRAWADSRLADDLERELRAVEGTLQTLPDRVIGVYFEMTVPAMDVINGNSVELFHIGMPYITAREGTADHRLAVRFFACLNAASDPRS